MTFVRFLRMFIRLWGHHQISLRAAALTYALILALIPLLAVCLSAFTLFVDLGDLSHRFMAFLTGHLAPGSGKIVASYIENFLAKVHFKAIGYVGFGALLITCLLLLSSIENSINRIWSIRRRKKLWKRVLIYNLLLIMGPLSISLSIATTAFVTKLFPEYILPANIGSALVNTLFLTFVYKIFPNKRVLWSAASVAGIIATIASELAKWGYAVYTAKALFYNKVYGGLAVFPLFLIWVYVNWNIFLGGALFSYMIQHRKSFRLAGNRRPELNAGHERPELNAGHEKPAAEKGETHS